ncbi:hypothetical protein [Haladaptatus sp. DYSN1]|uniref:hypothetical protein n=1 Tax=unclassified Haladaptatus TaxID=2622732 RepID=UPI002404DC30|nr:hypothetical protein [Haladaptatus sp. DYSN1]
MDSNTEDKLDKAKDVAADVAETISEEVEDRAPEKVNRVKTAKDEAEAMAETINVSELAQAINLREVPDAIDEDDLKEAITERDVAEALDVADVPDAADGEDAWEAMDVRETWRHGRKLVAALKGDEELDVPTPDVEDEVVDSPDDLDEFSQLAIQKKASDAVDEFREELLKTRARLKELHDKNREKTTPDSRKPKSRSPTAVSTVPNSKPKSTPGTRYSTVPSETKYSTAPNRKRIYGNRFEDDDG